VSGVVSAANSLLGIAIGALNSPVSVTALANGNYVVAVPGWHNGIGLVAWGSRTGPTTGVASASNSLVGSQLGDDVGSGGVTALANGNYVVATSFWNGGAGAVTWGNGTVGTVGTVSSANSLVGNSSSDEIGSLGVTALSNGNYVVPSPFSNGGTGAATWGDGTTGVTGSITSGNSVIGGNTYGHVGRVVTALTNGNHVVDSPTWEPDAGSPNIGTVTWGDGTKGVSGVISASNSFFGDKPGANLGGGPDSAGDGIGGVITLTNGNYVVDSPYWNHEMGAVTWLSGSGPAIGTVSAANSLVGTTGGTYTGDLAATAASPPSPTAIM
jgi:hypothetical protein